MGREVPIGVASSEGCALFPSPLVCVSLLPLPTLSLLEGSEVSIHSLTITLPSLPPSASTRCFLNQGLLLTSN